MTWLEEPRDGVEAALREALDQAARRTGDEIAHRRVWTHVATPLMTPPPRAWVARLGVLGVLGAAAAGGVLVWPHRAPEPIVDLTPPATKPSQPELPASPVLVRQPLLEGPTTIRSDVRNRTYLRLWNDALVDLEPSSVFSLDRQNRPSIDKGRVRLSVPRQKPGHHFTLRAGPYLISVLGTKFQVRVNGDSVGVDVEEGVVAVSRGGRADRVMRVEAGEAWTSPSGVEPRNRVARARERLAAVAPTPAPEPTPPALPANAGADQFRQAQVALAEGHPGKALEILESLARGLGPSAENAAYEVGKILRYDLKRPRQALSAWYRYRARFPHGMLRAETDISIVDALLVVGDKAGALAEADAFLSRYPDSERRGELTRIVQQLRGESREQSLSRREPTVPGPM
jgi:ferric-dicitrate binding protein FerR (iron transport regulator)